MKTWPELKSVQDIQVFICFANFYQRFIKSFNKIAEPLTLMLETITLAILLTCDSLISKASSINIDGAAGAKAKKLDFIKTNFFRTDFLTSKAWIAIVWLCKAFIKALILHYFDLSQYIRMETDTFGFAIGRVLSQMTLDQ